MPSQRLLTSITEATRLQRSVLVLGSVVLTTLLRHLADPVFHQRAAFIFYFPALVFSAWIGGWGGGLAALACSALAATLFFLNPGHGFAVPNRVDQATLLDFIFVGLSVSALSSAQQRAQQRAEQAAQEARANAAALKAAYEKEHRIAQALQRSLLQRPPRQKMESLEVETIYEPAFDEAEVGGDYYDVLALEGGRIALVVGDVSGKGLEAASHMIQVKMTLRAYLREHHAPAHALRRLNAFLCDAQGLDPAISPFFVCASLVVWDQATGRIEVSVCGPEPPLLLRHAGMVECVMAGGLPLGCFEDADYTSVSADLEPGDAILLVTDGITEARRGTHFLGNDGLALLAAQALPLATLESIAQDVVSKAKEFAAGPLSDDVCLLLARRR